jgi:arylsulfatase A-like enzyme
MSVRNVVLVVFDSLNRHLLGCYGGREFETPSLDRLARRAMRFDRHYAGSLSCIPARHDLLCGWLDFPWRPWGSVEAWERPITVPLRRAGVTTMLVSDDPHLLEAGGENYHGDFAAWEYVRGQEGDAWRTRPAPGWVPVRSFHRGETRYDVSGGWFDREDEASFPGPRTMALAADWVRDHARHHERFLLVVDEFDPHEPFDAPEPYASMYDDGWEGPHLIWPPYDVDVVRRGVLTPREAGQIRACYGAKLTMIDAWLGRLLDELEAASAFEDTAVVLTADHGHFLGEKDVWGKPMVPLYEELAHLPLLIAWPGRPAGTCEALTTAVDVFATIADVFGVRPSYRTHGRSLRPLLEGTATSVRDHVLAGQWGREVQLVTEAGKYVRAPANGNAPLSVWSNRWSTMPLYQRPELSLPAPDERARLDFMPGSDVPVLRQPFEPGDVVPFLALAPFSGNRLYDLAADPHEERNLAGGREEREWEERLRAALQKLEAPDDQLVRLGLD